MQIEKIKNFFSSPLVLFIIISIGIIGGLLIAAVLVLNSSPKKATSQAVLGSSVTMVGDKQVVNIVAKGGFSPSRVELSANKSTTLHISTNDTFDCSNTLIIPSLKKQLSLPANGETEVEIPAQSPGAQINATCSMGMYNLQLNFK